MNTDANGTPSAIDLAREAVSQFVEEISDDGAVLTTAVVVFETSEVDENGNIMYESNYAVLTETSLTGAVGIMTVAQRMLLDDALDGSLEADDD